MSATFPHSLPYGKGDGLQFLPCGSLCIYIQEYCSAVFFNLRVIQNCVWGFPFPDKSLEDLGWDQFADGPWER